MQTLIRERNVEPQTPQEAFAALYRDRYGPMVRLAYLLTSNNAVAEELVQDAFVRVYRKMEAGDGGSPAIDNPAGYLRQAVVNACRSHHRRRFLEQANEPEPPGVAQPPEIDEMWSALATLTPKRRTALVLRFYEDLKIDEIAEVMGCSPGTVKSLVHRGLASLRKVVES